ncbi:integrase family protein [Hyphomonas sp. ND6WE1B]|uniref:integrase family protein n=1 Tax=Hyphomonas sp. ND6WE1B TaxID=1848191 RepID=UPI0008075CD8|nr:integrase family protein [Hyphomonas sp. ND6WE1B]
MDKKQPPGLHWDRDSLGARVWKNGYDKSWVWQRGNSKRMTLGRWPHMTVLEAREAAASLNSTGPKVGRRTITELHDAWARDHLLRGKSPVTVTTRTMQFKKHAGDYMNLRADQISKVDLMDFRAELAKKSVHVARDVTGHIAMLIALGDDRRVRLPELKRPKSKRRKIADIGEWWDTVDRSTATQPMKAALAFAALTGLREGEITAIERSHIKNGWLHVPKPKMGTDWAFDRHLPTQALALLDKGFPGKRPFEFDKIRIKGIASTHACRHHFVGLAESETAVPRRVMRALVNHRGKTDVTDGYGEVPPETLAKWSQEIADLIAKKMKL